MSCQESIIRVKLAPQKFRYQKLACLKCADQWQVQENIQVSDRLKFRTFQIEQILPQYASDNDAQLDGVAAQGSLHGAVGERGVESWWGEMRVEQFTRGPDQKYLVFAK